MRNLVLLFSALILGTTGTMASGVKDDKVAERNAYRYNDSFIFVENGITFSVFPDGEFDFYIENRVQGRRDGITFNSGYDYSPYAQYDDYGAVIQVENVPIYYDYYGRVTQIGDVDISYAGGRVHRLGGMYVYYNRNGYYDHHSGYINVYNRYYTYRPFHGYFARPSLGFCLVFNRPYRRYYSPIRYSYYSPYRYNQRRAYATIGKEHRYNKVRNERASVYRNDKRVAVRDNAGRSGNVRSNRTTTGNNNKQSRTRSSNIANRNNTARSNGNVTGNSQARSSRSDNKVATRSSADRSNRATNGNANRSKARSTVNRSTANRTGSVKAPARNTVTKRTVTRTPQSRTVTRSTTAYKAPKRSTVQRSASKAPSRSRSAVSRSSSSRGSASKAPARSSRSKGTTSARSRGTRQ